MTLVLHRKLLERIHGHGEDAYPEEGAGFLLGVDGAVHSVKEIMPLPNGSESGARFNRYLISAEDYMRAELAAEERGMALIGVFHSHPDHPDRPSGFDQEWAQPKFSYLITSIPGGKAAGSRSWRLAEDRTHFVEEEIRIEPNPTRNHRV